MPLKVIPSPVSYHGKATKPTIMPRPPDAYHQTSSTVRRRITPQATRHVGPVETGGHKASTYSMGSVSNSPSNLNKYRPRPPDYTRRATGPIIGSHGVKLYDETTYGGKYAGYSSKSGARDTLADRRSNSLADLTTDMLRLPLMDETPSRTYKNSSFGSVTESLYRSSIEDSSARRPRDSTESRTSSASSHRESFGKPGDSFRRSSYTKPATLRRTPSLVTLSNRRSSINDYSSRQASKDLDFPNKAGRRGLKNIGNTCYMNTIVQCLSSIPDLSKYCLHDDYLKLKAVNSNSYLTAGKLFQAFAQTIQKLWDTDSSESYHVPYNLKRQIGSMLSHEFRGYRQHDAAEFLLSMLAELSEDVNRVKEPPRLGAMPENLSPVTLANMMWNRQQQLTQSVVSDIFNGLTRSTLKCKTCNYTSVTFEIFFDLSVSIPTNERKPTLVDCLQLYTKPEMLTGDNQFLCDKCKCLRSGTKKMEIERCPRVLIIQLKRFSASPTGLTRKVDTFVDFPLDSLDVSPYVLDGGGRSARYQLQAICNHYGGTTQGHYIAYCRHQDDKQWYKYDDERVTQLKESNVVTANAYVLFYISSSKHSKSYTSGAVSTKTKATTSRY